MNTLHYVDNFPMEGFLHQILWRLFYSNMKFEGFRFDNVNYKVYEWVSEENQEKRIKFRLVQLIGKFYIIFNRNNLKDWF